MIMDSCFRVKSCCFWQFVLLCLIYRYGVADQECMVVILPDLMVTKYDKPYQVLEITDNTDGGYILVSLSHICHLEPNDGYREGLG